MDVAIIIFYASAVGATIIFALLSQSKTIQSAALMISGVWLFSMLYFLSVGAPEYFLLTALLDGMLAFQFWRMSKNEVFPCVLCCLLIGELFFLAAAALFTLTEFWTIFGLNRIFELMLAYIIGASIYRIRKLRPHDIGDGQPEERSLKFIAG